MKKWLLLLLLCPGVLSAAEPVYHAGNNKNAEKTHPAWEVSVGGMRSQLHLYDTPEGNLLFSHTSAVTGRGLYFPRASFGVGVEGAWFSSRNIGARHTYKSERYGVVAKILLTPDTAPAAYLLVGAGRHSHRLSYGVSAARQTAHAVYGLIGGGVEVPLNRYLFVGAELQGYYSGKRRLDALTTLHHRWTMEAVLRGGVRF